MQAPGLGYARLREEDGAVVSQDPALKNFEPELLKALLDKMGL